MGIPLYEVQCSSEVLPIYTLHIHIAITRVVLFDILVAIAGAIWVVLRFLRIIFIQWYSLDIFLF